MKPKEEKKKTPLKDRDLAQTTHFIRASVWALPFLGLLGVVVGYVYRGPMGALLGAFAALAVSLAAGLLIVFLTDAIGGTASGLLFGRRRALWTLREQVQGTLNQARFRRENSEYEQALEHVNTVLSRDSEYPEALLLKAEILWDGYQELEGAKRFLEKVLTLDFEDRIVYNRSESLYDLLVRTDTPAKLGQRPQGLETGLSSNTGTLIKQFADDSGSHLKQALQKRKVVDWAVIGIILSATISLLAILILSRQLNHLDTAVETAGGTATRVHQTAGDHAKRVGRIDASLIKIEAKMGPMQKKLKP